MSDPVANGTADGTAANGGDLLVQVLRENGCEVAFGIVSVHNLPLVEAVDRDLRWVTVRHEAAAVNAADAYSRATGKLGCAITSTGTGAGNAAGSMVEALSAGSRVLHVTGNIDSGYIGQARGVIHETKDQMGMLQAVSKAAYQVPSAEAALDTLRTATADTQSLPSGPVSVEWPIDLQYAPAPAPAPAASSSAPAAASSAAASSAAASSSAPAPATPTCGLDVTSPPLEGGQRDVQSPGTGGNVTSSPLGSGANVTFSPPGTGVNVTSSPTGRGTDVTPTPSEQEITQAAALLAGAQRPAFWLGGGAREARAEILALAERLGAAVFTSNAGRGTIPEDHDLVIGNFAATPAGQELLKDADVLLSVGTHFRSNETKTYKLVLPAIHIQVDVDKAALGRAYPVTLGLHGEAAQTVAALTGALPDGTSTEAGWREQAGETRVSVREKLGSDIGPYAQICRSLRDRLDPGSPIARDVTIPSSQWGNRLLPITDPRTNIFALGGGIGQGLAMGIGASLARPDVPTVVIAGDGGLSVHLGELVTVGQERPWLVIVVFNDGGYGVLRNMQDKYMSRRSGVDLFTPDFGQLASSCGLPYARVTSADGFDAAFAAAVAMRGPSVVEIDMAAVGPTPVQFTPPVAIPGH